MKIQPSDLPAIGIVTIYMAALLILSPLIILPVIALAMAIGGIIRPAWPLVAVAVLLLAVNALVK